MLRKIFLLALFSAFLTAPASAAMLKIEGLANFATLRDGNSTAYKSDMGLGGGAELGFMLSPSWSFDIGLLYVQRKFKFSGTVLGLAFELTQTQPSIEVPIMLRYWLGSMVNIGVGGYYSKYLGSISRSTTFAGLTAVSSTISYAAAEQVTSDYGASVALGFDFPLGASTGFIIDGRYNHGLKTQGTSGSAKFSDAQGVVGLRFGGMK